MVTKVLALVLVAVFATSATALQCQTCKGNSCNNDDIPVVECSQRINRLPYGFESSSLILVDSQYACLSLEYQEGTGTIPVRQCYIISEEEDLCDSISSALPLEVKLQKCYVRSGMYDSNIPEDALDFDGERAGDPSTTEKTETTTLGAGSAVLSLSAMMLSIIIHRSL